METKTNDIRAKIYNLKEVAEMLGVSLPTIRRYIKAGKIKVRKQSTRKYLITHQDYLDYLDSLEVINDYGNIYNKGSHTKKD